MFKIDKVKSMLDCGLCNKLLVSPVALSCGSIVCKTHIDEMVKNKTEDTFDCVACQNDHLVPKEGFVVSKQIENLLNLQLYTLKAGPEYDECKKVIEEAKANYDKIETLQKNSECYIYEYFEDIKRQVDLRREDLKLKIDSKSDEIIRYIEKFRLDHIKVSKKVNKITANIEKSKTELDLYITQFDTFEINDKKFEKIKNSVADVNKNFDSIIKEYNDSLLGNEKYSFRFDKISVNQIFGNLQCETEEVKSYNLKLLLLLIVKCVFNKLKDQARLCYSFG